MTTRRTVSWFVALLLGAGFAQAQVLPGPDPRCVHVDQLSVKLAEGSGAELRDGVLVSRTGVDLAAVQPLFAAGAARPLVTAVGWDELDRWHKHACAVLPPRDRPGHLGLWFRLTGNSAAATVALYEQLRQQPLVTDVYWQPRHELCSARPAASPPVPIDIPPTTPLFASLQLSHDPTPLGHGVRLAAGVHGARGLDVKFVMMENSYLLDHEDVEQLVATNFVGPVPPLDMNFALHGLSGAALVAAGRNAYGITGIADEVTARFMSLALNGGVENALAIATTITQPGDVVLVVIVFPVPYLGTTISVPFEFVQSAYDASVTFTALGRHLVVPAGNGNHSLDDPAFLNRFDRNFRDSGAIVVASSQAGQMQRAPYSNWGSRIDAHSWGDQVVSCGYGTLFFGNNDWRQSYTAAATGTSSSTPHIAGLVAMVQGAARKQLGAPLGNTQLRSLLQTFGPLTPDVIGRRPDMVAILQSIGVFDGLAVDRSDMQLLDTVTVTMDGPPGSLAALFAAFAPADVPIGFNRNVHLDPVSLVSVGAFFLPAGNATYSLQVPNSAALHDADLYFQAVRLSGASPLHLTNSCQVTVL